MFAQGQYVSDSRLPAMATLDTGAALPRHRSNRDRLMDHRPCRPNPPSHIEYPGPQFIGVVNPVPHTITTHQKSVWWLHFIVFFHQQEIHAHLCPVPGSKHASGFPLFGNGDAVGFDQPVRPTRQPVAAGGEQYVIERYCTTVAQSPAVPHVPPDYYEP